MWGAKVKMPVDMSDDMLKDAITTSQKALADCANFETDGEARSRGKQLVSAPCAHYYKPLPPPPVLNEPLHVHPFHQAWRCQRA